MISVKKWLPGALLAVAMPAVALADQPEPTVEQLTVTFPQADKIATVTSRGTAPVTLTDARFDARFDTLIVSGTWKNATGLIFREVRLKLDLLDGQQKVVRTLLGEEIAVFHQGQRSTFTLMQHINAGEGVVTIRPRIVCGSRSYQEEYQRNSPRLRGR